MSRIGKLPIHIPQGVTVAVSPDNTVTVKGPKGQLSQQVSADLTVTVEENEVHVARHTEDKEHKAQHGLYRALLHNMVVGVSEGYTIKQELVGVGFRANAEGSWTLQLNGVIQAFVGGYNEVCYLKIAVSSFDTILKFHRNCMLGMWL